MTSKKSIAGALAALALAAPMMTSAAEAHGWGWRGGGPWPWIGLGAGAVVAGAIIADSQYRPRQGYYYDTYAYDGPYYRPAGYGGDPRRLCAQYFRSFEWDTGYYTTYGGDHRLCPYLR